MADVTFTEVAKRYGDVSVIENLNLHIDDHELMVLVGPSGCGKSTALRMIAGLEDVSAGTVSIGGRVVNDLAPKDRDIAMVFQSYALYPHMSVRENLEFGLKMRGVAKDEMNRRVNSAAEILGISHVLDRKPKELSGGQRQRVAVGRAIVRQPAVFLFDEPLSNLDAGLRAQLRAELKRLHASLRATFVYVTHDQAEAMTLSDRIAVLDAGQLQQVAPPKEIYDRPANRFVAEFFGTPRINVVPGRLLGLPDGEVGVRPEHLEVLSEAQPGAVEGTLELIELTGAETWLTVAVAGQRLVARAGADYAGRAGERVRLRPAQGRVLRFG